MIDELFTKEHESKSTKDRTPGFAQGLVAILPGFDDPIERMEEYL